MLKEITDSNFEAEVLQSTGTLLVDFYRQQCAVCPELEQLLVELAPQYAGRLTILKLNTDTGSKWAQSLGVTVHPTSILFKNGKPTAMFKGAGVKTFFKAFLDSHV